MTDDGSRRTESLPEAMHRVAVRHEDDGRRRLFLTRSVREGEEIAPLVGTIRPAPTRFSIQVGPDEHLDDMGPLDATNHACEPSAFVDFSDERRLVLRATRDLAAGDEVTIHYCATEFDMESPFECDCGAADCVGLIRGYRHLPEEAARRVDARLSPVLQSRVGL